MKPSNLRRPAGKRAALLALVCSLAATNVYAKKAPVELGGVACETPPAAHCPDAKCPGTITSQQGSAVEPATGRKFFLDYPCDLKPGEKVTFILSLHGAGSIGNWHRHYFPLIDYKDKYRLVIATPTSSVVANSNPPSHVWNWENDDVYLQNIVNLVYAQSKEKNFKIKAFWLAGHSQGGSTSSRLIRTDFFKDKVDGFLSLSGGRIGGSPGRGDFGNLGGRGPAPGAGRGAGQEAGRGAGPFGRGGAAPAALARQRFFRSYTKPASTKWMPKASPTPRHGRKRKAAERGFGNRMWPMSNPGTSMTGAARIQAPTDGDICRGPALRKSSRIQAAGMAGSSTMSCVSARDIPKDWSRTSPKNWSS